MFGIACFERLATLVLVCETFDCFNILFEHTHRGMLISVFSLPEILNENICVLKI